MVYLRSIKKRLVHDKNILGKKTDVSQIIRLLSHTFIMKNTSLECKNTQLISIIQSHFKGELDLNNLFYL